MQNHNAQKVSGSHLTAAYLTLRTNETGALLNVTVTAPFTPWFAPVTYVAVERGARPHKISSSRVRSFAKEGVRIDAPSTTRVNVTAAGWAIVLTRRRLYKPLAGTPSNYLDVAIHRLATSAGSDAAHQPVHGVIGQSFDPKHRIHANGKLDDYSTAEVTTSAQGEGAIEGVYTDYMLPSAHTTQFKFSCFNALRVAPTRTNATGQLVSAFTETNEAQA